MLRKTTRKHEKSRWTFHANALVRNVSLVQVYKHLYECPAEKTPTAYGRHRVRTGRATANTYKVPKLSAQERCCIALRYTTSLQTMPLLLRDGPSKSSPPFSGPAFSEILVLQIPDLLFPVLHFQRSRTSSYIGNLIEVMGMCFGSKMRPLCSVSFIHLFIHSCILFILTVDICATEYDVWEKKRIWNGEKVFAHAHTKRGKVSTLFYMMWYNMIWYLLIFSWHNNYIKAEQWHG